MNKLISEHNQTKNQLETQIKENLILIETTKKDYQQQLSALKSDNESKYLKNNEDITDKMQQEIESIQLKWQQEQQSTLEKHQQAIELLSDKLTAKEGQLDHMTNQYNHSNEELRTLKIAYEKMIEVKDKEIKEATEEKVSKEINKLKLYSLIYYQKTDENRVQSIVAQHQKEINVLQTQFQQLLDLKDKELEGFSYRLKTVTTSQQKDLEKLNHDYQQKLAALDAECQKKEEGLNSKTLELRWSTAEFESSEVSGYFLL
jgi:hypothetical protein